MKKLLFVVLLFSSICNSQIKIQVTNRLSSVGVGIGLSVVGDTTIQTVNYFLDGVLWSTGGYKPFAMTTDKDGFHKVCAKAILKNLSSRLTDTVSIFVAKKDELSRLVLETIKYSYKSQTFPDSLIQLPEHTLILGYTHYTTLRTLIKYLNPTF